MKDLYDATLAHLLDVAPGATWPEMEELIRCGAVSYCVDQLVGRYRKLRRLLDGMSLARTDGLEDLLDGVAAPVRAVLTSTGVAGIEPVIEA